MAESLADQVYRCLLCGHTWKGARLEIVIDSHVDQPRCPECNGYVQRCDFGA
jgi:DNA-directed RNA polymerase subunit RPC12/RpoP